MKQNLFYIVSVFLFLIISGCKKHSEAEANILQAGALANDSPEEAKAILEQVGNDYLLLPDKWKARYVYTSCLVADKLSGDLPAAIDIEDAERWYGWRGTKEEKTQVKLYLGRAYVNDKAYDRAMTTYLEALTIAKENNFHNLAGYISSYMGDLYIDNNDWDSALIKYQEGAELFLQADNIQSVGYAYRDMGRTYYFMDSFDLAIQYMLKADSIAKIIDDKRMRNSVNNGLGNVYIETGDYEKAEEYLLEALQSSDSTVMSPNVLALYDLYVSTDRYEEAEALINAVYSPDLPANYLQIIHYCFYQLSLYKKSYIEALRHFEQYYELFEKDILDHNRANYVEMEKRYDHIRLRSQVQGLIISRQNYIIIFILLVFALLLVVLLYRNRLLRANIRFYEKEKETKQLKERQKQDNLKRIEQSDIRNRLLDLIQENPMNKESLINEELWLDIKSKITDVYPQFYTQIQEQFVELNESEIQYCYLCLFNFDTNQEAVLLSITIDSVKKRRNRIRRRNAVLTKDVSLYNYLINSVLN